MFILWYKLAQMIKVWPSWCTIRVLKAMRLKLIKNASILLILSVRICFMHAIVFTCAYLFIWSSVLFGYCRTESWSNWADTRLWLILLMSDASRGEDTERKNCQTNIQVTSFIPPTSSLPLCLSILRKGLSAPLVQRWLHHCLLRLLSLLQVCRIYLERDLGKDSFCC